VNAKAKGRRNEWRSRRLLEAEGYKVTRAGGSLGTWDLIGIRKSGVVLVQVKTRDLPGTLEMRELVEFPAPSNCTKLVHRWVDGQRLPDTREL
jgi:Holliday junction resolvase